MKKLRSSLFLRLSALLLACAFGSSVTLAADYTVTAANVKASKKTSSRDSSHDAGVTITRGQAVYLDTSVNPNVWKLADANLSAAAANVMGVALNDAVADQPLFVVTHDESFTPGFTIAAGEIVILSATAGAFCPVADAATGMYVSVAMIGTGSNKAKLSILQSGVVKP
jgi:hypothetical protein